jgi:hypothetical protein
MDNTTVSVTLHVNGIPQPEQLDSRVTLLDALRDHLSPAGAWSARLDIAPPQGVAPLDELNVADGFLAFVAHAAAAQALPDRFSVHRAGRWTGHPLNPGNGRRGDGYLAASR